MRVIVSTYYVMWCAGPSIFRGEVKTPLWVFQEYVDFVSEKSAELARLFHQTLAATPAPFIPRLVIFCCPIQARGATRCFAFTDNFPDFAWHCEWLTLIKHRSRTTN